jgi:hypothetical protein
LYGRVPRVIPVPVLYLRCSPVPGSSTYNQIPDLGIQSLPCFRHPLPIARDKGLQTANSAPPEPRPGLCTCISTGHPSLSAMESFCHGMPQTSPRAGREWERPCKEQITRQLGLRRACGEHEPHAGRPSTAETFRLTHAAAARSLWFLNREVSCRPWMADPRHGIPRSRQVPEQVGDLVCNSTAPCLTSLSSTSETSCLRLVEFFLTSTTPHRAGTFKYCTKVN